jgi:hypothetical protein
LSANRRDLRRSTCLLLPYVALVLFSAWGTGAALAGPEDWALTAFGGRMTDGSWPSMVYNPSDVKIADASLFGLAVSRRLWRSDFGLEFDIEGQVVKYTGDQTNWEFNLPLVARWTRFPWSDHVKTSAAFGLGLSWAASTPEYETAKEGDSQQLLTYWMLEFEAGPPDSRWSGITRIHHRSTAFGTFGPDGGANSLVVGIRRRF